MDVPPSGLPAVPSSCLWDPLIDVSRNPDALNITDMSHMCLVVAVLQTRPGTQRVILITG